jgi:hypothetical protein
LADDPAFPLGGGGHHRGEELAGGRAQINAEVEGDEVPALAARSLEQAGEVDQAAESRSSFATTTPACRCR